MDAGQTLLMTAVALSTLLVAGTMITAQRLANQASRRQLSFDLVQQVRLRSPWYQQAVSVMREFSREPSATVERSFRGLAAHDGPQKGHPAGEVLQLLDLFEALSIGIRQGALDESIIRYAFEADLDLACKLARSPILYDGRFGEVSRVAAKWRREIAKRPSSAMR
jgi:hypothetical protein